MAMNLTAADGGVAWTNEYTGRRTYTAWNDGASMPSPAYVGTVVNQDLHALPQADMVIFTLPQLRTEAERLADMHRNESPSLTVHVVEQEQVFNEFGSGQPDPNAFRRMLKMLHDRDGAPVLKYALLMGRGSYDNRAITPDGQSLGRLRMPLWESEESLNNDNSYTTDDIIALLDDDSGINMPADKLTIAVGRIPATSVAEARIAVDKIREYMTLRPVHEWKNRVLLLADDGNDGIHMNQSETVCRNMLANPDGDRLIYDKVYIDAFERTGGQYPLARSEFHRALDEGVMLWCYIGHGSPTALTADGILTYSDINSMYLRRYPILYAATCDFVRWDRSTASGAELLHFFDGGGTIATVSATRPVLISENGTLSAALATEFTRTDDDGRFRTIGELYRTAKNAIASNANKLRYVLMGDPALRIATPDNRIIIESINGASPDAEAQLTLQANETVTVKGYITASDGSRRITDFSGIMSLTLYDADYSTTSLGWGSDGRRVTFDQKGKMLYTGTAGSTAASSRSASPCRRDRRQLPARHDQHGGILHRRRRHPRGLGYQPQHICVRLRRLHIRRQSAGDRHHDPQSRIVLVGRQHQRIAHALGYNQRRPRHQPVVGRRRPADQRDGRRNRLPRRRGPVLHPRP